jgi:hypothetical protein
MSDSMIQTLMYGLAIGAGLWLVVAYAGAKAISQLEKADLNRLEGTEANLALQKILTHHFADQPWLSGNGFKPLGVFRISNIDLAVWQREGERTYLSIYFTLQGKQLVDIESMLDNGGGVVTGNMSECLSLPTRPGVWKQCMAVESVAELCRHHNLATFFLTQSVGARPSRELFDIELEIVNATKAQCTYVRSIRFWFLKLPYWYFVRRNQLFGVTVREQIESQGLTTVDLRRSKSDIRFLPDR